jgi:hypothetical protein
VGGRACILSMTFGVDPSSSNIFFSEKFKFKSRPAYIIINL